MPFSVHDKTILGVGVAVTKGVPGRLQALAVAAPWRVELDEDILAVVEDDLVKLLADQLPNALGLLRGDRLALERRLDLAIEIRLDKRVDRGLSEFR